jgi:hypothetical protein
VTSPGDTYIHGHADSVLRSHRWRTADNSAAYLLPHLADGTFVLLHGEMVARGPLPSEG